MHPSVSVNVSDLNGQPFVTALKESADDITKLTSVRYQKLLLEAARALTNKTAYKVKKQFSKRDHHKKFARGPYSKKSPHPPIAPYYINMQSHDLFNNWRTSRHRTSEYGRVTGLYNVSNHASIIFGHDKGSPADSYMMKRPMFTKLSEILHSKLNSDAVKTQKEMIEEVRKRFKPRMKNKGGG